MRLVGAGLALLLFLLSPSGFAAEAASLVLKTASGPHRFSIELAATDQQRLLGLMYRRALPHDAGMLFLYDRPQMISMWMKNTFIPLDMIFIGPDARVHRIAKHAEPFSTDVISSDGEVQGILEVNAGTADAIGLKPGDEVIYPGLGQSPEP
jgi:uncharacterized protein